jgi:hypothetical protein
VVEQGRRRCEGVDLRCVERRDFRVVGGVVQHKGGGVAVIVRRPQEAIPRGDPVPGGERSLTQFGHPARGAFQARCQLAWSPSVIRSAVANTSPRSAPT